MSTTQELIKKSKEAIKNNVIMAAEAFLKEAIAADPNSADAKVELARIMVAMGKITLARKYVDEALTIQAKHPLALAVKGGIRVIEGRYSEAIPLLKEALELDPKSNFVFTNLGIAQRELGFFDDAEASIRKAIDANSQDYEAYYALGHTLCAAGKVEDGIQATLKCIEINPGYVKGYLALGALYDKGGRPDLAEQLYDECLKRVPEAVIVREKLQEMYMKYQKFEAAQAEMEIIAQQKSTANDWMKLGNLSVITRKFKVAELAFRKAAELSPKSWEPHYNLGDLYDAANLTDVARKEYELAIKHNTGNYKPHHGMGLWFMKQNQLKEAIEQLAIAHQLSPTAPEPAYNLALALAKAHENEQAKALLKEVISNPGADRFTEDAKRLLNVL